MSFTQLTSMRTVFALLLLPLLSNTLVVATSEGSHSSSSSSSFSTSNSNNDWGLHYHHSPWLEKDFLTLVEPDESSAPTTYTTFSETSSGGSETSSTDNFASGIKCSEEGTEDEDVSCSCRRGKRGYRPSMHCISRWSRQQRWRKWPSEVLVDEYVNDGYDVDTLLERANEKRRDMTTEAEASILSESGRSNWPPFARCDYLTERTVEEMCHADRKSIRPQLLGSLTLRSCRRFAVDKTLRPELYKAVVNNTDCGRILRELLVLDDLVEKLACEFESILMRYDCAADWSRWRCEDCQMAYRDWLCSTLIPYYLNGQLAKPCQSICEQVEQKCPHLHPYGKGQYAGEPVFLCIDANIPFNEQITPYTPYGKEGECYNLCDLERCQNDAGEKPSLTCWQEEIEVTEATSNPSTISSSNQTIDSDFTTTTYAFTTSNGASTLSSEDKVGGSHSTTSSSVSGGHDDEHNGSKGAETSTTTVNNNDQSTTLPSFGWNSEDDAYYQILQTGDRRERKLTSSGGQQYLEMEPSYVNEGNNNKGKELFEAMDSSSYDATESGNGASVSSANYQASLQEIYREAMAVTTVDSMMAAGVGNEPLSEIELPEELAEEWIHIPPNVVSSVVIHNNNQQSATTSSSTSAVPPFDAFLEQLTATPPTGTESSSKHHNHNHFKTMTSTTNSPTTSTTASSHTTTTSKNTLMTDNHSVENGQQISGGKVDGNGGVNGRQFRHHNSRSKQQQTGEQQTSKGTFPADQHREKVSKVYKEQDFVQKKSEPKDQIQQQPKRLPDVSAFSFRQQSKVGHVNAIANKLMIDDGIVVITSSSASLYQLQFKFVLFGFFVISLFIL